MNEDINELIKVINAIMGGDAILQTVINKEYNPKETGPIRDGVEWGKMMKEDMVYELAHHLIEKNLLFTKEIEMPDGNIQYRMMLFSINPRKQFNCIYKK